MTRRTAIRRTAIRPAMAWSVGIPPFARSILPALLLAASLLAAPEAAVAAGDSALAERIAAGTAAPGAAAAFFENLPDLPLMPGMAELTGEGVVFDQPAGRIVEAVAVLPRGDAEGVRAFYARTLPELGWKASGPEVFSREGETLKIEVVPEDGRVFLRVAVMPR